MDDLAPQTNNPQPNLTEDSEDIDQSGPLSLPRRLLRGFGLVLVVVAIMLGVYGTVAYTAWQSGETLRVENAQTALEEQLTNQINLAQDDIANGNFLLATRRLDWVLERVPDSVEALSLRDEAQSGLNARLTPTAIPSSTPTPEKEVVDSPVETTNQTDFDNLVTLMEEEEWEAAISAISAFQRDFPNERRQETDEMLYNAYTKLGVQLVSGTQIELGLFYLGQAERLGDLTMEIEDQRTWAELYLDGIGYYGVNWETTIFYFRGLCSAAPFYQDACQKLYEAYVAFGDQYAVALDWCPAEEWYSEAVRLEREQEVIEKRREAATNCLEATPTPIAPLTDTTPISDTIPSLSPTETAEPQ